ncbi:MAG: TAXI family TRAP transporter solute-binding subunit [Candidatus Rokubacteria bacterium]|nr:TAXI family TRAP transporter solute-binding subunit [Candidatus Rokubacteria bacterium]
MSSPWRGLALAGALVIGLVTTASGAVELGLITGSDKGTYYQFGLNLRDLVKGRGFDLSVYPSRGSIENVYAVYQRPATQLGIVQSDVLAFVARVQTDPVLKRIAKKTKMVFPLYNEEIQILARREITDFDDLADRRVAIGREGSGTYLTARLVFKVSEVNPKETVNIDTQEALDELKAGRIDAMFYVAGVPVKLFAEGVAESDNLHLLPITNKSVQEFYPTVEIPARTYAFQATPVNTVAVKAVLISFDFRRKDCDAIGQFAQILYGNRPWLVQNGHPKWKSVDLDAQLRGWEQYDCVRKFVRRPGDPAAGAAAAKPASGNPVMDAIRDLLDQ